jgi:hypothetical protein
MAAPVYDTDLTPLIDENTGNTNNFTLVTDGGGGQNALTAADTDDFIEGSSCASRNPFSSSTRGIFYNNGAVTIPSGNAVYIWAKADVAQAIGTKAAGGIQIIIGNNATTKSRWYVDGNDTYQIGGWKCYPIDPTVTPSTGSHTSTAIFGCMWNVPASGPTKGQPFKLDAIRYGRALIITDGDLANGYATLSGAATFGGDISRQWGQLQFNNGVYTFQGLLQLGITGGNSVDFRDQNKSVFIAPTDFVQSTFNGIEVRNAASRVDFTNISFQALGTVSKGYFEAVDNADVNIDGCTFTDMSTFVFQTNSTVMDTVFRRCGQITLGGAAISDCTITNSTASSALLAGSSVSTLSNTTFISSGTGHAIEITGGTSHTLNGITFTDYTGGQGTSTGNEAVFVNIPSGSVTINSDSALTYRTAGATVTVVAGQKTLTISNVVAGSDVVIKSAGTTTKLQDDQDIAGTTSTYSYTYSAGTFVDVAVYSEGYVPYFVNNFELPAEGGTIQVAQQVDRNYRP